MDVTLVNLLVPDAPVGLAPSPIAEASLLVLRVFTGICFIRHGWPKLKNLQTWSQMLGTPAWLCFLSAGSMWAGGIALVAGVLTPIAAFGILVSMAYAMVLEMKSGLPFVAVDPYLIPEGDYAGPLGVGEPPSWEKAAMYVVMCVVLIGCGGGWFSIDHAITEQVLQTGLTL